MKYRLIIFLLAVLNIDFCSGQNADSIRFVLDSANQRIPLSANILIVKNGQRFFEKSYGYADVEKHKGTSSDKYDVQLTLKSDYNNLRSHKSVQEIHCFLLFR